MMEEITMKNIDVKYENNLFSIDNYNEEDELNIMRNEYHKLMDESIHNYLLGYKQALLELKDKIHTCKTKLDAINLIDNMIKSIGE